MKTIEGVRSVSRLVEQPGPSLFVSVGAGPGEELSVVREKWPGCRIVAIDPVPSHCRLLARRADRVIRRAVWSYPKVLRLYCGASPSRRTSAFSPFFRMRNEVRLAIKANTLDNLLRDELDDTGDVFLWIDVEGAECEVLKGARLTLQHVRWINVELSVMRVRHGPSWREVDTVIRDCGFESAMVHSVANDGTFFDMLYLRTIEREQLRWRIARRSYLRKAWRLRRDKARQQT